MNTPRKARVTTALQWLILVSILLVSASCGSGSRREHLLAAATGQPIKPIPAGNAVLPSPGQLRSADPDPAPRSHQGSVVVDDYMKLGEQFDPAGPRQNAAVVINTHNLRFSPTKAEAQDLDGLAGLAYATFRFDVPDYDRDPTVRFLWDTPPSTQSGTPCWIGLSNWERGSWDWMHYDNGDVLSYASLAPYFDPAGRLYVVIALSSSLEAELESLRLGGPAPTALLSASPRRGAPPLLVSLDASASQPGSDSIVSFEWDPDGDGDFDPGLSGPQIDFSYSVEGSFDAWVRVTNELGNQSTASIRVQPGHFWQRSFGLGMLDSLKDSFSDSEGNLYLVGGTEDPAVAQLNRILLLKLDPGGQLLWARRYGQEAVSCYASCLAVDASGNILVGGTEYIGDLNAENLLLKWNPDGELLWAQTYGNADDEHVHEIVCKAGSTYFCGDCNQPTDMLLCKLNSDGVVTWLRGRDLGSSESGLDLDLKVDLLGDVIGVTVLGRSSLPGGGQLARMDYDNAGDFSSAAILADNSLPREGGRLRYSHNFIAGTTRYTVSGTVEVSGNKQPFVLVLPPSGDSVAGYRLSGLDCGSVPGLLSDGSGGFYLGASGRISGGDFTSLACLLHIDSAGQLASAQYLHSPGNYTGLAGLQFYSDGLLISGYGPDAFTELQPLSMGSQVITDHWVDTPGINNSPQWSVGVGAGSVADMTSTLVQDSGGGGFDTLVNFVPLPD